MHDFLRSLPVFGVFVGVFGAIFTMESSPLLAVVLIAIACASVAYMRYDGRYGID